MQTSAEEVDGLAMQDYPFAYLSAIHRPHFVNMSKALRPFGITPQMWRVLAVLVEADGRSVGDLAGLTATERSNLTRILSEMEDAGLVFRNAMERDKRFAQVFVTEAGRAKHQAVLPAVRAQYDFALRGFSHAEMRALVGFLRRMKQNLGHQDAL